jgi:DNA-binding transcriptional LysR family regulator
MKALEREVGCLLLDRLGKKIVLTQAGEQLLHHAEKILGEMSEARDSLERLGKWGRSRLRIGASATACQYILPPVLGDFQKSYPNCLIAIEPGDTESAVEMMDHNRVDLAITLKPRQDEQVEFVPLFADELCFLVGPSHAWARNQQVVREAIPKQNYVLYNKNSYTFKLIEDYFGVEDMELNTVIELGSMEAIKELVKLGLGVSILAPWIAQDELRDNTLASFPLGRRKLKRHWGIVYRRHKRLNMAEETFVGLCKAVTQRIAS